jgi:uncharacterized membrane protein
MAVSAGLLLALPLVSYLALRQGVPPLWFGAVDFALATLVLVALLAGRGRTAGWTGLALVCGAAGSVAAVLYWYRPAYLVYLPCMFINAALAWLFQRTLGPDREPLITGFARIERAGQLPAVLAGYTRRLTVAWTLFFYALLAESVLLAWLASTETYLLFANTLNYVLVAGFFLIEYIYRRIRYHQYPHASPLDFIRMLIANRVIGGGEHS